MRLKYKLINSDFLEYQLYTSSKSEATKKRLRNIRIFIPIAYLLFGLYLWNRDGQVSGLIMFGILALLWFIFYPKYAKWKYKRHFLNHIKEHYSNRINKPVELDLNDDFVDTKDHASESGIKASELKKLIELPNHYFLKMSTDLSLIIPKNAISDQNRFKEKIKKWKIDYVNELNWKWN